MRSTLTRGAAAALLPTLGLLVLAGCGGSGGGGSAESGGKVISDADVSGTMRWGMFSDTPSDRNVWNTLAHVADRGMLVARTDLETAGFNDYWDKLATQISSGSQPDIITMQAQRMPAFVARKAMRPLDGFVAADKSLNYDDFFPAIREGLSVQGKPYALGYDIGPLLLFYNKDLFQQAGLDPENPPTTWQDVAADAKKIAALGGCIVGYADYSANNQGGWHFTTWMKSVGGDIAKKNGDAYKADFNNDKGKEVLRRLKEMRWDDGSMGEKQLLEIGDVQNMMGAGQLGMYLAAPDNVAAIVNQFKGKYDDYGLAAMPEQKGTLLGGVGYMINPKATPEQIKAGLKWIEYKFLTPGKGQFDYVRAKGANLTVGQPYPDLYRSDTPSGQAVNDLRAQNANIDAAQFAGWVEGSKGIPPKAEPGPYAQEIYKILDTPMSAVLTRKDANIDQLLSDAESKVNSLLASKG